MLGTFRPEHVLASAHPLRTLLPTLIRQPQVTEFALALLTEAEVAAYLVVRCSTDDLPPILAHVLHQRTDGNPLFLVTIVDHLTRWRGSCTGPPGSISGGGSGTPSTNWGKL